MGSDIVRAGPTVIFRGMLMSKLQRTSPLSVLVFAASGAASGFLTQVALSSTGRPPLVPPLSLALTLMMLGVVLLTLAVLLRRAVAKEGAGHVNPFHAVRLLAAAKASQFAGALLGGFALGLLVQVLTRSVVPPASTWAPMLAAVISALLLVVAAAVAEHLCKVPPSDAEHTGDSDTQLPEGDLKPGPA